MGCHSTVKEVLHVLRPILATDGYILFADTPVRLILPSSLLCSDTGGKSAGVQVLLSISA
jgi:hypothetical protein